MFLPAAKTETNPCESALTDEELQLPSPPGKVAPKATDEEHIPSFTRHIRALPSPPGKVDRGVKRRETDEEHVRLHTRRRQRQPSPLRGKVSAKLTDEEHVPSAVR